jgi:hypothetical protein
MKNKKIAAQKYSTENQVSRGMATELEAAFVAGADWRINSVWNDASEKPKYYKLLVALDNNNRPWVMGPDNKDWKNTVAIFCVKKWAYIEDLIPSKEE